MGLLNSLKKLDAYPKLNEDFFTRTFTGGIITVVSSLVMILLFISELTLFLRLHTSNELNVDTSRGEKLQINVDIVFHHMGCATLSLDAMDVSGEQHLDVVTHIFKQRLDEHGMPKMNVEKEEKLGGEQLAPLILQNGSVLEKVSHPEEFCGSCFGAEETPDECCNTCEAVRSAYTRRGWAINDMASVPQCKNDDFRSKMRDQDGEGCNIYGYLEVNKVAGNFHFAPGKSFQQGHMHVHDLMPFESLLFNLSHTVNKLSFGADFPGVQNPMDKIVRIMEDVTGMYQYFVKVVPTVYRTARGRKIDTNQFSVTEHFKKSEGMGGTLPGVFVFYDLSPIKVNFTEERTPVLHFVTNLCAILGGVFTVSGIVDSFVYHGQKAIAKKSELGKLG